MNKYENFQYVPGTRRQVATVDYVGSFLWFKWKKTLKILRFSSGLWYDSTSGMPTKGYAIEYLERIHNATTTV